MFKIHCDSINTLIIHFGADKIRQPYKQPRSHGLGTRLLYKRFISHYVSDKNLISPYSLINTVPNKYTMGIRDSKTRDCLDVSPLNSYNRHQKKYKIERIYKMKKEEIKKRKKHQKKCIVIRRIDSFILRMIRAAGERS